MTGGDVDDGSQISRPAIEVYGNDGAGSRSDDLLNQRGINVRGSGIDIHKDRLRPGVANRLGRRDECVRSGNDFIARPDAGRQQRQVQSARTRIKGDAVLHLAIIRKRLFKSLDLFPQNERSSAAHPVKRRTNLVSQFGILRSQIEIRHTQFSLHAIHFAVLKPQLYLTACMCRQAMSTGRSVQQLFTEPE